MGLFKKTCHDCKGIFRRGGMTRARREIEVLRTDSIGDNYKTRVTIIAWVCKHCQPNPETKTCPRCEGEGEVLL